MLRYDLINFITGSRLQLEGAFRFPPRYLKERKATKKKSGQKCRLASLDFNFNIDLGVIENIGVSTES
ncbi:hypothetical protein MGYG_03856 [Nannizzia gypsea CBS 118893]|uniref:Uncharacterized protein n=1 Tax=Arthroderma gypseum (strain ATCC MYA-4604 / CBS 118893) TaxID=535722 RepID=E4UU84_ARTGP|nr:hypothetical protein MGYG_03856 [Nannizzia gypsea CBS 118893]EFR00851.1 hypothetical protein MGYG_03856 [Nannizzia gypsea CBS 118893]